MKLSPKEAILFAIYKDAPAGNVKHLENTIYKKYGFMPSKELTRRILNYQIKKYGSSIDNGKGLKNYVKDFGELTNARRTRIRWYEREKYKLRKIEERSNKK